MEESKVEGIVRREVPVLVGGGYVNEINVRKGEYEHDLQIRDIVTRIRDHICYQHDQKT